MRPATGASGSAVGRPPRGSTREYRRAGLLDELHLAVVPVLLGDGERLFQDLGTAVEGWTVAEFAPSAAVAHVRLRRPSSDFDTMEV
jgi:hypothetical protein